jgi:hypothetical protein
MLNRVIPIAFLLTFHACSDGSFKSSRTNGTAAKAASGQNAATINQSQDSKSAQKNRDRDDSDSRSSSDSTTKNCEKEHDSTATESQHSLLGLHGDKCEDGGVSKSKSESKSESERAEKS